MSADKITVLIDLQYLPNINWILTSIKYKNVKFSLSDISQKMSFRNKCYVVGSNGLITLSIPLQGGRDKKQKLKDIRINNDYQWQILHWKTIQSCYKKSPYFDHFEYVFKPFFQNHFEFLYDFNFKMISKIFSICKLETELSLEPQLNLDTENTEIHDLRNSITPKNYLENDCIKYLQVFEDKVGFKPNMSILDLLMNDGLNWVKKNN